MKTHRQHPFPSLDPARVVVVLALVAVGAFLAEHVRPGHHIHVGPDGPRHHHHAFLGAHDHDDGAPATAHAHHEPSQSEKNAPAGPLPETPDLQGLLTASALMTPSAPMTLAIVLTLVLARLTTRTITPLRRRSWCAGGPRAPPRLG